MKHDAEKGLGKVQRWTYCSASSSDTWNIQTEERDISLLLLFIGRCMGVSNLMIEVSTSGRNGPQPHRMMRGSLTFLGNRWVEANRGNTTCWVTEVGDFDLNLRRRVSGWTRFLLEVRLEWGPRPARICFPVWTLFHLLENLWSVYRQYWKFEGNNHAAVYLRHSKSVPCDTSKCVSRKEKKKAECGPTYNPRTPDEACWAHATQQEH